PTAGSSRAWSTSRFRGPPQSSLQSCRQRRLPGRGRPAGGGAVLSRAPGRPLAGTAAPLYDGPAMAAKKNDLDDGLASVYRGPLEGFTAARNELAKQLRKLGQDEDADRVKSLTKPPPSAWAVNALFERDREKMDALLAAGKKARTAQQQAVSGRGAE